MTASDRELTPKDRKFLRGLAHKLDPIVRIGHEGITEAQLKALDTALATHELIKVKFLEFKDEKAALCQTIEERTRCACVGMVGHVATFYRQNPDPEKRRIVIK